MDAAEREFGGDGRAGRVIEQVTEFAVAQQVEDLAADAAGFGDLANVGESLQDKRFDPGQAEFGGERQTGRSCAHDDHVNVRHASPSRRSSCSYVAAQRFWSMRGGLATSPGVRYMLKVRVSLLNLRGNSSFEMAQVGKIANSMRGHL